MEQEIIDKIINDFVEKEELFRDMKEQVSFIVRENDNGNVFDLSYDDFCIQCLKNMKNKDMKKLSTAKIMKQYFLESIVQIATDELKKRGRVKECEQIQDYL